MTQSWTRSNINATEEQCWATKADSCHMRHSVRVILPKYIRLFSLLSWKVTLKYNALWGNWANTIIRKSYLKGRLNSSKWITCYRTANYKRGRWMPGSRSSEAGRWIFILACLGVCHQHHLSFLLVKVLCSSIVSSFSLSCFWPSPWRVKHTGTQPMGSE